jgi:hypothetical protein
MDVVDNVAVEEFAPDDAFWTHFVHGKLVQSVRSLPGAFLILVDCAGLANEVCIKREVGDE